MKKLLAWLMAVTLTVQLVTPVFAEEIEETQTATEAVEMETEAPATEIPTTEPTTTDAMETAAPEETSAPTEPQPTTEVTEATETTASTEETTSAATEPTEETTEPALDLFAEDGNVIASGTCGAQGENLTWVLTEDGTLTISGSGKMQDYSDSSVAPWYTKRTKILSVVVEDGVTSIGNYAFYACLKLASVTLPEGIKSTGYASFRDCTKLAEVTIPNSVTSIGYQTFYNCSSLTSVTIPEGVTSINASTFYGCSSLTSVSIPKGVTSIGDSAFSGCSSLTSVIIAEGVTSIGWGAFYGCSSLTSVNIPEGVTSIDSRAFQGCSSLTSVTIPGSVAYIGVHTFEGCSSLTSVTIQEGVTSIVGSAFQGCSGLTSVSIPDSVTSISDWAFYDCGSLTSVTIPEGVTSIGSNAFSCCSSLGTITVANGNEDYASVDGVLFNKECTTLVCYPAGHGAAYQIPEGVTNIGESAFEDCSNLTSVIIAEGVTSIGGSAFYGCSKLTSVTIPDSVASIGDSAFAGCSSLTSVTIPEGVTSIGDWAFYDCGSLISVTIPDSVTSIGADAFYDCGSLISVTIPDSVTSIGEFAFRGCSSLTSVIIAEGVTSIDTCAFDGCSSLTSVTIPEGVTSIDSGAFYGCSGLTSVTIPEGVMSIDRYAFQGCSSLTSVTIPEGVTSISKYAFQGCSSLTSVTIPEGVTSIGDHAFQGCSSLTSVTIPEGVTSIGDYAFSGCSSLTSVKIPEGVTSIGTAFSGCSSLTSVKIPEGVTSIDSGAFYGCSGLTSVTIPEGVTSIGNYAFKDCDKLKHVYYGGSDLQWKEIQIEVGNWSLTDATIHYGSTHIHNTEHTPGKAATCTEAGNLEYWHCLVCDTYFTDEDCTQGTDAAGVILPALGHSMSKTSGKAATCTEDGSNAYYTCSSCHTVFKDAQGEQETTIQAEIVPALGHDMTKVEAVAPTYVAAGNNEYYTCSRCGKVFKDEQGKIETTVEAETLKGTEIRPVATNTLISGSKLTLTAWTLPGSKKAKVKWSLSEDSKAYASISSSGVLTAKTVSEVQNITVIATPTDGSLEARKEIQILPKITVKQTEKLNLFYGNGRAKLAITGGQVTSARFVEPTDFVLDNNDGQFYIRLAEGASVKPKTKVTLEITLPGCDTPIRQSLTIATTNTAPKLKLNPTASIVNTTLTNSLTVETAILGTEDTLTVRSATKGVTASVDNGILTLTLDTPKTTTATVYLKGSDWAKEIKLTHRITVTDKKPTVKFAAKGKLDVLNPASEIIYTPKLSNATGTITDVRLDGQDANLFNAEVVDGRIHLTMVEGGEYATRATYKVTPVLTVCGQDITGPTLRIKVTQSALKLEKLPNRTVYQSQTAPLAVKLTVTSPANAKIGDVQLNVKTTAALRKALEAAGGINFEADTVTFPASAFADLKPGKYTVILDVFPANAANDTKPIQARFTLTVQK